MLFQHHNIKHIANWPNFPFPNKTSQLSMEMRQQKAKFLSHWNIKKSFFLVRGKLTPYFPHHRKVCLPSLPSSSSSLKFLLIRWSSGHSIPESVCATSTTCPPYEKASARGHSREHTFLHEMEHLQHRTPHMGLSSKTFFQMAKRIQSCHQRDGHDDALLWKVCVQSSSSFHSKGNHLIDITRRFPQKEQFARPKKQAGALRTPVRWEPSVVRKCVTGNLISA